MTALKSQTLLSWALLNRVSTVPCVRRILLITVTIVFLRCWVNSSSVKTTTAKKCYKPLYTPIVKKWQFWRQRALYPPTSIVSSKNFNFGGKVLYTPTSIVSSQLSVLAKKCRIPTPTSIASSNLSSSGEKVLYTLIHRPTLAVQTKNCCITPYIVSSRNDSLEKLLRIRNTPTHRYG